MSDESTPQEIVEQCDRLIERYEEGLALVKRLRRTAMKQIQWETIETTDGWGRPIKMRRPKAD